MIKANFYNYRVSDPEEIFLPSETIPDQSLTVRDILRSYTRGQIELPPVETGENDTFDSPDEITDEFDAMSAMSQGASILRAYSEASSEQNEAPPANVDKASNTSEKES